jgi:pyruvate dehydrogenase E2 component (dihydrolipoamide acetyltransferase)
MRRAIAKTMSVSATIPQFGIEMVVSVDPLASIRAQVPPQDRPSFVDAIVASVAKALSDHPWVNASFTEEGIVRHEEVNVALALALDDGLISPVISSAERRSIDDLLSERKRLTEAARAGSLKPEEILSGTFTISNLGPLGVRRFNALVVPPQAGILALGSIVGDEMTLTLSVDHRVVDGAPAARFLGQICSQLEDDAWLGSLFGPVLQGA